MADQYTRKLANIIRDNALVQYQYMPALGGAGATGVAVSVGAGPAWGSLVDLAAASGITTEFWVCGVALYTLGQLMVLEVQLYNVALTRYFANFKVDFTAATLNVPPLLVPYPVYQAANSEIQARAGGTVASKSVNAHLVYATGF